MKRGGKIANRMKSNPLIATNRLSSPLTWNREQKWYPSGRSTVFCFKCSFIKSVFVYRNKWIVSHRLPVRYVKSILIYVKFLWDSWETLRSPKNEFILLGGVDNHGLNAEIILLNYPEHSAVQWIWNITPF